MEKKLNEEQAKYILSLFNLVDAISSKYDLENGFNVGMQGMLIGLRNYIKNKRHKTKLHLYLVWYIRTAIEHKLGIKSKDTQTWEELIRIDRKHRNLN